VANGLGAEKAPAAAGVDGEADDVDGGEEADDGVGEQLAP